MLLLIIQLELQVITVSFQLIFFIWFVVRNFTLLSSHNTFYQSHNEINTVLLFESIFYGIWAVNLVFIACELGQQFTNLFDKIDDRIELLDWYLLPLAIQRMLPTIFINTQKPIAAKFFGNMSCCREQFKKVEIWIDIELKIFDVQLSRNQNLNFFRWSMLHTKDLCCYMNCTKNL